MTSSPPSRPSIEAVYRSHGHHVLRRASRLLGSEVDAREVLQDVFLSLLDDPSQFAGRSSLATWLYAATTHLCLNRIRNQRVRSRIVAERAGSLPVASSPTEAEDGAVLREVLARLPEDLARVAVYYYGDEMTHEEIAGVLGCSRRQVGNLVERLTLAVSKEAS
jgi:RNA polymerase sigma factor (sigma-70 family)